ncbi:MAG: potassium-transporting ATPase subunit KdpA [Sarcina sp.]
MKTRAFLIIFMIFIFLSIFTGKYLYKVIFYKASRLVKFINPIENLIYKLANIKDENMDWKKYIIALLVSNLFMVLLGAFLLIVQSIIFGGEKNLSADLIFNTVISFMTNTNLQNYSGEMNLTNISQIFVITVYMFTSAATGFAIAGAFIRGITGSEIGNFYKDLVRIIVRFLLPVAFVISIVLISQGVPQTLESQKVVETIEGSRQTIMYGPVASLESIKHLGTNGGGFFAANSAHPFENPTPMTNLIEMLAMMIVPGALIVVFGKGCKNKKQARMIFIAVSILLFIALTVMVKSETSKISVINQLGIESSLGNIEGKEVRFGSFDSSIFSVITTAFTTGSVNNVHESLTPIGAGVVLCNMMVNSVFGGKGVGILNIIIYGMLGVFICGLMIGRTPEFLRKKIEGKEMKLISSIILVHPIIILVPTAVTLLIGMNTMEGYHGLTQVLYEFTSAAANNGSGFEGLQGNIPFFNILTGLVMIIGRYISMILIMALAGSLSKKNNVSEDSVAFKTDTPLFIGILIASILIVGALTFFPVLVLGPGAEFLTL